MKLNFFILFSIVSISTIAQEDYIVTIRKDTVYGDARIVSVNYPDKVILRKNDGKKEYQSFQVQTINIDGEFYDPIIYQNKRTIARRVIKGSLSYYKIRPPDHYEFYKEILLKENLESTEIPNISFRKMISGFLSECIELQKQINDRIFTKNNIREIVHFYNNDCQPDEPPEQMAQKAETQTDLLDLAVLVTDIYKKKEAGDPIPHYMIKSLERYRAEDLSALIEIFLEDQ
ncbi:MAG: hypothetical protein AAF600_04050 [Bacteroidota bacterium]